MNTPNNLPPGVTNKDIEDQQDDRAMAPLQMGDITISDDGNLGFSFCCCGNHLGFVNKQGELSLMEWIAKKHGIILSNVRDHRYLPDGAAGAGKELPK
jgi:hypothetical protein